MLREMTEGVYYVGVDDNHTSLFENLWPIPFGVSYNSYLIVDEKIAVIETVKNPFTQEWIDNIKEVVDPSNIDYIILNHMEPDHTGSLPKIAEIAKNATIILTPKAAPMCDSFFDVQLKQQIVEDLEEISLGKKTLRFVHAQFLHWPETMMSYLLEDEILFSCDAFGSYGALNGKLYDDEVDMRLFEMESKRYLSTIITSYFRFVQRGIQKVKDLGIGIKMIAPSHGPIYRKDPMWVIDHYDKFSSPELEKYVTIVFGSMYGYTLRLAHTLKKELVQLGVDVKIHNISYSDMSKVITDSVRAGVLVIGTPTYDAYPFPKIWAFMNEMEGKRFPKKPVGLFGTYGWGGGGVKKLQTQLENARFEVLDPVIRCRARPTEEESKAIKELSKRIAEIVN
ncbi:MAG: FprA family A-type flavoprotein [Candidatus Thorarchaeota archaeon]